MKIERRERQLYAMEYLAAGRSAVHALHPAAKLPATSVFVICVVSFGMRNAVSVSPYLLYLFLLAAVSETPWRPLLAHLALALPLLLPLAVSNLLLGGDAVLCVTLILKAFLTVSAVLLLVAATGIDELFACLARMYVPQFFIMLLMTVYRYLGLLLEQVHTMRAAYLARTLGMRNVRMADAGVFVGQLRLRSIDRAERVHNAMLFRGYHGTPACAAPRRMRMCDVLFLSAITALSVLFRLWNVPERLRNLILRVIV